jgi:large repetitive protein
MYQPSFANVRNLARLLLLLALNSFASARASDVINTAAVSFDGPEGSITLPTNVVRAIAIDPLPEGGTLFLQKTASRDTAEIGDFVDFAVRVKNVSTVALRQVVVEDGLPFGFIFQAGTAAVDGAKVPDPQGGGGPSLSFPVGSLDPGRTITLTYRTRVGVDAPHGDGINRAQATTQTIPPATSNIASVRVILRSGVFTNRGVIFGKVFVDKNHNRVQDAGEVGIPGVRLYTEDGSYAVTDAEGKYSFYGILPRTHVVKLDPLTLPPGAMLEALNTRNAGDGGSVFAEMKGAEMRKVNFAISNASGEIMAYIAKMRAAAEANAAGEVTSNLKNSLDRNGPQSLAVDPRSLPSSGLIYPGVSVQPTTQDRTQSADSFVLGGGPHIEVPAVAGTANMHGFSSIAPSPPPGTTLSSRNLLNPPPEIPPSISLEQAATENAGTEPLGFIDLKEHDTLPMTQTTVRVKSVAGAKVSLRVNGREIPDSRIGKRLTLGAQGVEATEYIGVQLQPGENELELLQIDQFGNPRGSKLITVIAPDTLGRIQIKTPDNAVADGKTPARVIVELVDNKGVPVTARTALTLEATMGKWLATDLNPREPGVQVFIEGGRAEFALAAPVEPGDSRIRISSGVLHANAVVSFLPELRPLIGVGVVEGVINARHLSAGALRPVSSGDTFDTELRNFAVTGNRGSAAGRAAFFLKGKILGSYLLTASYDSEKATREHLFRDIQPDEFYPVYGDSSIKGFEAQSTGKLYVRIDNKKSYLLYGDFVTQAQNDVRQLGNYNRSLNGVREHYENKNVSANAWASYDNTRQVVEELRANGTSGPYSFHSANGLVNSEKIEVLTRDRNNPGLVIKSVLMTRFSDYEFEPLTGQILFKAPIPSLDADLNPISIRVTYEIEQGGGRFWVYGADAQAKINDRIQVGGAFARDENPFDRYGLYSGNAVFDLGMKTFLIGEFAHSEDAIEGHGNAERFELRHSSEKLSARIFWGRADTHFKNQTAILTAGRTEGGAQISYQLGKTTRALVQAVDTEAQDGGSRRGVLAGIEQTFGRNIRLELDGRYSTETATPASPSTAATFGATPNEVRSVRAKLTLPLPWTEDAGRIYGEYEQDILESDKRLAAIGLEYQLDTKTRLYLRHELISSLGGPFELNTVQQQNTTVVGVESTYAKDSTLFNEYRARDGFTGREAEAAIGLRNGWTLAQGLRLSTTFERVDPLEGATNTNKSTAVTGGVEYTGDPNWKGTARAELRTSQSVDSLLETFGFAYKLNDNWTALTKSVIYLAHNKGLSAVDQTQARVQAGFAWRQTSEDVWNALGKYEFRTENGAPGTFDGGSATGLGASVQRRVNILSLDVNCQPSADWQLSGHYAGKLAFEDSNGLSDVTSAHLFAGHFTRDLTKRIDIGIGVNALVSGDGGSAQFGFGPEIGVTLTDNLRAGFGYNLSGFRDDDLTQEQYTARGFYVALRLKFDEQLFNRRKQDSLGDSNEKQSYEK